VLVNSFHVMFSPMYQDRALLFSLDILMITVMLLITATGGVRDTETGRGCDA